MLDMCKVKAFADDILSKIQHSEFVFSREENMCEKDKTLVISIFSFSHNVFKRLHCQGCSNCLFCDRGLDLHAELQGLKKMMEFIRLITYLVPCIFQVILDASAGINYETFLQMLKVIVTNRLHVLDIWKISGIGENNNDGLAHFRIISNQQDNVNTEVDKLECAKEGSNVNFTEPITQGQADDIVTEIVSDKFFIDRHSPSDKWCNKSVTNRVSPHTEERLLSVAKCRDNSLTKEMLISTANLSDSAPTNGHDDYNCRVDFSDSATSVRENSVTKDSFISTNLELPAQLEQSDENDKDNSNELLTTVFGKYSDGNEDHVAKDDATKYKDALDKDQMKRHSENVKEVNRYVLYDLYRIKETLVEIINDKNYRELDFGGENKAEFLYEQIEAKLNYQKFDYNTGNGNT